MFKITVIISLLLIGSTLWAASLSCDSCGSECAAACGTRHFRSCCFNYLRRKRGPDSMKLPQNLHDYKPEGLQNPTQQFSEDIPDIWGNVLPNEHSRYYPFEDTYENRFQAMYDA